MKLTNTQFSELINQHNGTGYLILKITDNQTSIIPINLGKSGEWYTSGNGHLLSDRLKELTKEIEGN